MLSWSITDIELYLNCEAPREMVHAGEFAKRPMQAQSATSTQESPQFKAETCWKFQSPKGCEGSCLWPTTHNCYGCEGPRATRVCPTITVSPTTPASTQQPTDTKNTFRAPTEKTAPREDRDRREYKEKGTSRHSSH